jgi:hypothetical protein
MDHAARTISCIAELAENSYYFFETCVSLRFDLIWFLHGDSPFLG